MRLGLVAAKPTDAVTYGLLPAAVRLGLEVFLLTDQPDGHAGALARRVRVSGLRALRVGDLVAFGLAGAYAWNISHHGFLMHPPPAFHCLA